MKKIICIFILSLVNGQTQYSAVNSFFSSTSLSLGGAGYLSSNLLSLKNNPAVENDERLITTSIINYKNGISSQSFGVNFFFRGGNVSSSLKNISYGTFDKYDENKILKGTYQSSENWFTMLFSKDVKNLPLKVGVRYEHLFSQLEDYFFQVPFISIGGKLYISNINMDIGISVHEININIHQSNSMINPDIAFSTVKKLKHLPLELYIDLIVDKKLKFNEVFFGGIFNLKQNMQLYIGSSSRKLIQNNNSKFFNTIFGASGVGINYSKDLTSINIGSYMYGTGYLISGLQINIKF
tara:strand:- start:3084 stop:3971 length:888 start_codon:yes stop_codon:yes gene_type:complete